MESIEELDFLLILLACYRDPLIVNRLNTVELAERYIHLVDLIQLQIQQLVN